MDIQRMMKQAQVMQTRMQELQERLAETEVNASAGGDAVKVTMTCKGEVRALTISPAVIDPTDKETLEDLVMAAINNARVSADQLMADQTRQMMAELGLPANAKLPF
jgi:DNA-binding YbaB/EbfC family protein